MRVHTYKLQIYVHLTLTTDGVSRDIGHAPRPITGRGQSTQTWQFTGRGISSIRRRARA